ncbi:MAG: NUDIX domain-containing protein [Chloroflexi bacterium]|nr:NUDIX domain-containing protein [Chloroflexota bacterium]
MAIPRRILIAAYIAAYRAQRLRWWATRPVVLGVRVLLIADGEVVLVRHTYRPGWFLPGGSVKRGESLEAAARREVAEETGLEVREIRLMSVSFVQVEGRSDHVAQFASESFVPIAGAKPSPEIAEVRRFPVVSLPPGIDRGAAEQVANFASGLGEPGES